MRTHYIYVTTNLINGKKYLGQRILPTDCKSPEKDHYIGSGTLLLQAIKKYGRSNFSKEIIFVCFSNKEADEKEIELIKQYKCLENKNIWYNRDPGGQFYRHEDHSSFVSNNMKKYYNNPENLLRFRNNIARRMGYKNHEDRIKQEKETKRINKINAINSNNENHLKVLEKRELKKRDRAAYLESSEYKENIKKINKKVAKILDNKEIREKYEKNRYSMQERKIREEGNELYIFLINHGLHPLNHYLETYNELTRYKFGRIKNKSTIKKYLEHINEETTKDYGFSIDCDYFLSLYTTKHT